MAFVGIGYTAEAGAHATGHHVLEAHLATDAALGGRASHGLHHRRGAAGVDDVVGGSKGGVGGNDAVVAERAIVGGYGDLGAGLELGAHGDEVGGAASEEYSGTYAAMSQRLGKVQQGCDACAATHHQHAAAGGDVGRETVAEGVDEVERVAFLELRQAACAAAHDLDEQGEGAGCGVGVVDGDGAPQHHLALALDEYFDKLARHHGLHPATMLQGEREVLAAQLAPLRYGEGVYLFHDIGWVLFSRCKITKKMENGRQKMKKRLPDGKGMVGER